MICCFGSAAVGWLVVAMIFLAFPACQRSATLAPGSAPDTDEDTDTDSGTDPPACDLGTWWGDVVVSTPEDLTALAGYTAFSDDLIIEGCGECVSLETLACVESVADELVIRSNPLLASLSGMGLLTSVGSIVAIVDNPVLADLDALGGVAALVQLPRSSFLNS